MLFLNKPVQAGGTHYHSNANADYNAIDIGGVLDLNQVTALVQQAAARLPANQQLRPGEVWGYQITVHVTERTAQAVMVRPYPLIFWADIKLRELLGHLESLFATAQPATAFATA